MTSAEGEWRSSNAHKEKFSADSYSARFSQISKTDDYFLMRICDSFDSGRHKGERFLDLGCGPSLIPSLVASRVFQDIYLSDYCPSNLEAIKKWFNKDPTAIDWSEHIGYLAEREQKSPDVINARIRLAVKGYFECDITRDGVLLSPASVEPFDCIASTLCLEVACCAGLEEYRAGIARVRALLKPGGSVIICGGLESTYYINGGVKFPHLSVTGQQVASVFEDAGFTDVNIACRDVPPGASYTGDPKATYILTAVNPC